MLTEVLDSVVAELKGAGVQAAIDPRDLAIPGVWVTVASFDASRLASGSATVEVKLLLIAPDQGHSLADLSTLVDRVAPLYPMALEAVAVALPNHSPDPLPALAGTVSFNAKETP